MRSGLFLNTGKKVTTDISELELGVDESYELTIPESQIDNDPITAHLKAKTIFGVLHGLNTFSQLYYYKNSKLLLPFAPHHIKDFPRFSHRGLLLDTARNYFPVKDILKTLDVMSWNKFNVFHWHIVDATSWPVVSESFPELSNKGSYDPINMVYTKDDIKKVIEYAYLFSAEPPSGQLNPALDQTYTFLHILLPELTSYFTDKYYHAGGDEVNLHCWNTTPSITEYLNKNPNSSLETLLAKFINETHQIVRNSGKLPITWQEMIVDHNLTLKNDTLVQVLTLQIHNVDNFICRCDPFKTWQKIYSYNPIDGLTDQEAELVIGEQADRTNLEVLLWPRSSAAAEVLWSGPYDTSKKIRTPDRDALARLTDWRFRMVERGVNAEPLQPLWCARTGRCNMPY
ncbi:6192_t:CDS:2 [Racocetra fulgida]|uniref:beta-N-acetylhexosaminidase n=1 Tax=Racocetra fulgida TaxID=60492 RepID=A0A9N8VSR8_9GLOM|nr:6192_t:CDS:2 [Racocetra fulgida]